MNELTTKEIKDYRMVYFCTNKTRFNELAFGLRLKHNGIQIWELALCVGSIAFCFRFQTFSAYRCYRLALGPHRNC